MSYERDPKNPQEYIPLGDYVKRVTDVLGIKQCDKCKDRQERWNRVLRLPPWLRRPEDR